MVVCNIVGKRRLMFYNTDNYTYPTCTNQYTAVACCFAVIKICIAYYKQPRPTTVLLN